MEYNEREIIHYIKTFQVEPNRDQPRKHFDESEIDELAHSIQKYGILHPLLVQKKDSHYEIIAGERRWRAAAKAGLKEVPVIIKDLSGQEAAEISLIENIQRSELNPVETAAAYRSLMDAYHLTQDELAKRLAVSRATLANTLRILNLPDEVQKLIIDGKLTEGHARAILSEPSKKRQVQIANEAIKGNLSVRDVERITRVKKRKVNKTVTGSEGDFLYETSARMLEDALHTRVRITGGPKEGKIEISFYGDDDLERIYDLVMP